MEYRSGTWLKPVAIGLAVLFAVTRVAADENEALVEKGRYLTHAGGCVTCHTEDREDAVPLAGGRAIESPFGTFYSPNITPHPEDGIGDWSDRVFLRAFQSGVNPDGDAYYPAFPYTSYTGMSNEDLLAIKAYLQSLEPVAGKSPDHDLPIVMSSRMTAAAWKKRYFKPQRFKPNINEDDQWNRGAYLVRHVGHCGECHTPRRALGALERDQELAGNPDGPDGEKIPNITPHEENGIGDWSVDDIDYFLDIGMLPDGDFTGGSMGPVIEDSTSHLTREDRLAIAVYLKSVPAQ
ncbi:MAG: cytochrome c [Woeseia sp.]